MYAITPLSSLHLTKTSVSTNCPLFTSHPISLDYVPNHSIQPRVFHGFEPVSTPWTLDERLTIVVDDDETAAQGDASALGASSEERWYHLILMFEPSTDALDPRAGFVPARSAVGRSSGESRESHRVAGSV